MINEVKKIKISYIRQEEIEYENDILKKEEELKKLKENEDKNDLVESNEIKDLRQKIEEIITKKAECKQRIAEAESAKTLNEVGITFEEAISILKKNNIPIVLTEEDKTIEKNESSFEDMSDLMFVHKTKYFPQNNTIRTAKDAGAVLYKDIQIDGKNYEVGGKSERETIHFTLNTEVDWHMGGDDWANMKYTILIPGNKINEEQLLSLRGEDSYFKGNIKIPEGAYILVPEVEREKLQKENPELALIGYEGESKDYGTALLSSMGYKAQSIDQEKRSWKNEEDINKVYEIAKSKGKPTVQHCFSKEISEEDRGFTINYLSNLFKVIQEKIKENPDFANNIHEEKELLSRIKSWFIEYVVKGQSDYLNENRCETEGIYELIERFSRDGFEISEEQKEYMKKNLTLEQYNKMKEQYGESTDGIFSNMFTGQILYSIEQTNSREDNIQKKVGEMESSKLLPSAIEATKESTTEGKIEESKNKIIQRQKERMQVIDEKSMSK